MLRSYFVGSSVRLLRATTLWATSARSSFTTQCLIAPSDAVAAFLRLCRKAPQTADRAALSGRLGYVTQRALAVAARRALPTHCVCRGIAFVFRHWLVPTEPSDVDYVTVVEVKSVVKADRVGLAGNNVMAFATANRVESQVL